MIARLLSQAGDKPFIINRIRGLLDQRLLKFHRRTWAFYTIGPLAPTIEQTHVVRICELGACFVGRFVWSSKSLSCSLATMWSTDSRQKRKHLPFRKLQPPRDFKVFPFLPIPYHRVPVVSWFFFQVLATWKSGSRRIVALFSHHSLY